MMKFCRLGVCRYLCTVWIQLITDEMTDENG